MRFSRFVFPVLKNALRAGAAVVLFSGIVGMGARPAMATVPPSLPDELQRPADGKMVLLDFYSAYCGTCQMMEPHVKSLAARMNRNLYLERIDLGEPDNEKYLSQFDIQGTPTYILYDRQGKALYRMKDFIAPLVLERQVLRLTGQLKKTSFPTGVRLPAGHPLSAEASAEAFSHMILVAFENPKCEPCREMSPYLQGFELSGQNGLHVIRMDTTTPEGKKMMAAMSIRRLPAYVLFDNNLSGADTNKPADADASKPASGGEHSQSTAKPIASTGNVPVGAPQNTQSKMSKSTTENTPGGTPENAVAGISKSTPGNTLENAEQKRGELFRITGKVPPRLLWSVIRMFGDAGV